MTNLKPGTGGMFVGRTTVELIQVGDHGCQPVFAPFFAPRGLWEKGIQPGSDRKSEFNRKKSKAGKRLLVDWNPPSPPLGSSNLN